MVGCIAAAGVASFACRNTEPQRPSLPTVVPTPAATPDSAFRVTEADLDYVSGLCTTVHWFAERMDAVDEDLSDYLLGSASIPPGQLAVIQEHTRSALQRLLVELELISVPPHLQDWHAALLRKAQRLALSVTDGDLPAVRAYAAYPFPEVFPDLTLRLAQIALGLPACEAVAGRLTT